MTDIIECSDKVRRALESLNAAMANAEYLNVESLVRRALLRWGIQDVSGAEADVNAAAQEAAPYDLSPALAQAQLLIADGQNERAEVRLTEAIESAEEFRANPPPGSDRRVISEMLRSLLLCRAMNSTRQRDFVAATEDIFRAVLVGSEDGSEGGDSHSVSGSGDADGSSQNLLLLLEYMLGRLDESRVRGSAAGKGGGGDGGDPAAAVRMIIQQFPNFAPSMQSGVGSPTASSPASFRRQSMMGKPPIQPLTLSPSSDANMLHRRMTVQRRRTNAAPIVETIHQLSPLDMEKVCSRLIAAGDAADRRKDATMAVDQWMLAMRLGTLMNHAQIISQCRRRIDIALRTSGRARDRIKQSMMTSGIESERAAFEAKLSFLAGNWSDAVEKFSVAISFDDGVHEQLVQHHLNVACCYARSHELDRAIWHLHKAKDSARKACDYASEIEVMNTLGDLYLSQGRYEESQKELSACLRFHKDAYDNGGGDGRSESELHRFLQAYLHTYESAAALFVASGYGNAALEWSERYKAFSRNDSFVTHRLIFHGRRMVKRVAKSIAGGGGGSASAEATAIQIDDEDDDDDAVGPRQEDWRKEVPLDDATRYAMQRTDLVCRSTEFTWLDCTLDDITNLMIDDHCVLYSVVDLWTVGTVAIVLVPQAPIIILPLDVDRLNIDSQWLDTALRAPSHLRSQRAIASLRALEAALFPPHVALALLEYRNVCHQQYNKPARFLLSLPDEYRDLPWGMLSLYTQEDRDEEDRIARLRAAGKKIKDTKPPPKILADAFDVCQTTCLRDFAFHVQALSDAATESCKRTRDTMGTSQTGGGGGESFSQSGRPSSRRDDYGSPESAANAHGGGDPHCRVAMICGLAGTEYASDGYAIGRVFRKFPVPFIDESDDHLTRPKTGRVGADAPVAIDADVVVFNCAYVSSFHDPVVEHVGDEDDVSSGSGSGSDDNLEGIPAVNLHVTQRPSAAEFISTTSANANFFLIKEKSLSAYSPAEREGGALMIAALDSTAASGGAEFQRITPETALPVASLSKRVKLKPGCIALVELYCMDETRTAAFRCPDDVVRALQIAGASIVIAIGQRPSKHAELMQGGEASTQAQQQIPSAQRGPEDMDASAGFSLVQRLQTHLTVAIESASGAQGGAAASFDTRRVVFKAVDEWRQAVQTASPTLEGIARRTVVVI